MLNNSNLELDLDSLDLVSGGVKSNTRKTSTTANLTDDPQSGSKALICNSCSSIIRYNGKKPSRCPECSAQLSNLDMA